MLFSKPYDPELPAVGGATRTGAPSLKNPAPRVMSTVSTGSSVRISVTVTISTVCPGASGGAIFSGRDDTGAPLRTAFLFFPNGAATTDRGLAAIGLGFAAYIIKLLALAALLPVGETAVAKMRVFRYPIFLGGAFAAAALAVFLLFVSQGF